MKWWEGFVKSSVAGTCIIYLALSVTFLYANATQASTPGTKSPVSCAFATPTYTPNPVTLTPTPDPNLHFYINEVMFTYTNSTKFQCMQKITKALQVLWIEFYNPGPQPLETNRFILSIQHAGDSQSQYEFGMVLPGKGFVVDFIPYNLTKNNDKPAQITVETVAHRAIDTVTFPSLTGTPLLATGNSYARIPDGSNSWQTTNQPTLGSVNMASKTKTSKKQSSNTKLTSTKSKASKTLHPDTTAADTTDTTDTAATQLTQPHWQTLRFPHVTPPQSTQTRVSRSNNNHHIPPNTTNSATTLPGKLLLTVLLLALFAALQWSWRLFLPT
jgi:hypothetical protein